MIELLTNVLAQSGLAERAISVTTGWGGAAGFLAIGIAGWWLLKKAALRVAPSLLVGGLSLAASISVYRLLDGRVEFFAYTAHAGAALCLIWAIISVWRPHAGWLERRESDDLTAVAQVAAMASGLLCLVILLYVATYQTLDRILNWSVASERPPLEAVPLIDLGAIALAIGIATAKRRAAILITPLFWTLCFACLWLSLTIHPASTGPLRGPTPAEALAGGWTRVLLVGLTAVLIAFVGLQGQQYRRRRIRAWPNRMSDFTLPYPMWPGFRYSAGVVAILLIADACMNLGWWPTVACCTAAAAAMFYLVYRRWNENLADAAAGLITVAVTSAFVVISPSRSDELTDVYPIRFNYAMIGMSIMTAFWFWIARFWSQQLHDGRPWTTAGRMIPIARRFGIIVAGLALVVSAQLALWPRYPSVNAADDSTARIITGLAAFALLAVVLWRAARHVQRPSLVVLSLSAVMIGCMFMWVRTTGGLKTWVSEHWPMLLAAVSIPVVVMAMRARVRGQTAFTEPLVGLGTVVLPGLAIIGLITDVTPAADRFDQTTRFFTIAFLVASFMVLLVHSAKRAGENADEADSTDSPRGG